MATVKLFDIKTEWPVSVPVDKFDTTVFFLASANQAVQIEGALTSFAQTKRRVLHIVLVDKDLQKVEDYIRFKRFDAYWSGPRGINSEICRSYDIQTLPGHIVFNKGQLFYGGCEPMKVTLANLARSQNTVINEEKIVMRMGKCPYIDNVVLRPDRLRKWKSIIEERQTSITSLRDEINAELAELGQLKKQQSESKLLLKQQSESKLLQSQKVLHKQGNPFDQDEQQQRHRYITPEPKLANNDSQDSFQYTFQHTSNVRKEYYPAHPDEHLWDAQAEKEPVEKYEDIKDLWINKHNKRSLPSLRRVGSRLPSSFSRRQVNQLAKSFDNVKLGTSRLKKWNSLRQFRANPSRIEMPPRMRY